MIRHIRKAKHLSWHFHTFLHRHEAFFTTLIVTILSTSYFFIPSVLAVSLTNAKDTISTSQPSVSANHVVTFNNINDLAAGWKISTTFAADFDLTAASTTCPTDMTASKVGQEIICTATGPVASGTKQIMVDSVINPETIDSYLLAIKIEDGSANLKEQSSVRIALADSVIVTATVPATLQFIVSGTSSGITVNNLLLSATSTASSTPFGTLVVDATSTAAQELSVSTNASLGFNVTIEQDHEMLSDSGATINSFSNAEEGAGSTTPIGWIDPLGDINASSTFGHLAFTTGSDLFFGLNSTDPYSVMSHDGPADGVTLGKGRGYVAIALKITALQEAGDYANTLTYICTPTY